MWKRGRWWWRPKCFSGTLGSSLSSGRFTPISEHSECFSTVLSEDQKAATEPFLCPFLSRGDPWTPLRLPFRSGCCRQRAECSGQQEGNRRQRSFILSLPALFLFCCRQLEFLLGSPHPQMKKTEGRLFLKKDRCKLGFCRQRHKC